MIGIGKDMPTNCYDCPMYLSHLYGQGMCFLTNEMVRDEERAKKRNEDCPLVELKGEQQKTGHWIKIPKHSLDGEHPSYDVVKCSECKTHWEYKFKYCPSCGAKMKGE